MRGMRRGRIRGENRLSLADEIRKAASSNGTRIQKSEDAKLEKVLNNLFYLDRNIKLETQFIKQVMTRGQDTQERYGLHASALIVSDKKFCLRQQVLSLLYHQRQGEQVPPGLKRIFEEGNAIHEKWQRLFIRAGYSIPQDLDLSQFNKEFEVSYTPDIICEIPQFGKMVGEIKSVNTFQFKKMLEKGFEHESGKMQLQLYMHLTGIHKGFVLCEDKNTQEFLVRIYELDPFLVELPLGRMERVKEAKLNVINNRKMVARKQGCSSAVCKLAEACPMRDACYNVGMGRKLLDGVLER